MEIFFILYVIISIFTVTCILLLNSKWIYNRSEDGKVNFILATIAIVVVFLIMSFDLLFKHWDIVTKMWD